MSSLTHLARRLSQPLFHRLPQQSSGSGTPSLAPTTGLFRTTNGSCANSCGCTRGLSCAIHDDLKRRKLTKTLYRNHPMGEYATLYPIQNVMAQNGSLSHSYGLVQRRLHSSGVYSLGRKNLSETLEKATASSVLAVQKWDFGILPDTATAPAFGGIVTAKFSETKLSENANERTLGRMTFAGTTFAGLGTTFMERTGATFGGIATGGCGRINGLFCPIRNLSVAKSLFPQKRSYHEAVIEHFNNPRNMGKLDEKQKNVGSAFVGKASCGDVIKLQIEVDEESGKIKDAKFKTFGCGSAIASSSLATEMIKGQDLNSAKDLKNTDISSQLNLPPVKIHCSVLAEEAVHAAIEDYKQKKAAGGSGN